MQPTFLTTQPTFLSTQPTFLAIGCLPPQSGTCTHPCYLPNPPPPPPEGGGPGRSPVSHPTPRRPAAPSRRVDGSRLAGALPSHPSSLPACNVAPTWATTCAGLSDNSPSRLNFTTLYDICVTTGHVARVSVSHIIGYQDVTIYEFPQTPTPSPEMHLHHNDSLRTP